MASNSSVLREFLVKLGFKIDDTKYRDFQNAMRVTAKNAVEMSKTALAATTVMGAGLRAVAQQMESLYFASRRTGASVTELKTFASAAEQIGVSADQARAAVEGLAAARRTNPGLNGILGGLEIDPSQTDNAKVLVQLLGKLQAMPYYQGAQIAGLFGINEQTFQMLEAGLPEMQKYLALREKMYRAAGINPDQVANRSHEFNTHLRTLTASLELLTDIIAYRLMPWGEKVIDWLTSVVTWLTKADSATAGWSSRILGIASALAGGSLVKGGFALLGKLLERGGAAAAAGEGAAAGETAAVAGGGILSITGGLVAAAIGLATIVFNRTIAEKVTSWLGLDPKGHQITDAIKSAGSSVASFAKKATMAVGDAIQSTGLVDMVKHFEGFRSTVYADIGGNSTAFWGHKLAPGEDVAGKNPTAVLMSDLGAALAAVHRYVRVALTKNQENSLADFVFNVGARKFSKSTLLRLLNSGNYAGAADQFQFWNHALVNGHMTTVDALTRRRAAEAQLFRTPDRPIHVEQKNDYHVTSTDPSGAASEIERRQSRMTSDMVRNLAGAVQ